jgi:hypothetical protein
VFETVISHFSSVVACGKKDFVEGKYPTIYYGKEIYHKEVDFCVQRSIMDRKVSFDRTYFRNERAESITCLCSDAGDYSHLTVIRCIGTVVHVLCVLSNY